MKPLFSFLLIFFSLIVYCQKDNYDVAKKEFENFIFSSDSIKIQSIKNEKFKNIIDFQQHNHRITRLLDFGLTESVYELRFIYSSNRTLKGRGVDLHIFYSGGKEVGKIINYNLYENEIKQISRKFEPEFNNYIIKHNSFYNVKTKADDFFKDILNREVFGNGCGYEMIEIKKIDGVRLDSLENVEQYISWMKSYNVEKQMWGYSEINKLLKKNLIELESDELKIFNNIKERNLVIETCSGCVFGIFERAFK